MNDLVQFRVTATVETALKKLKKHNIAVYKLKKRAFEVYFSVEEEYTQKVFAIFSHPCYNICISRKSAKMRAARFIKRRCGLLLGAALFVAACVLSDFLVLRIKVVGSGSYLAPSVIEAAGDCGAKRGTFCKDVDKPLLISRILSLPDVTFCSVQRRGSYLIIDVRAEQQDSDVAVKQPLKADCGGEILKIVALSGTPEKSVGEYVSDGDVIIGAYRTTESGERQQTLAVGYVQIKRKACISLFYDCESEQNALSALAATALYSADVMEKSYKVSPCDGGVTYTVDFTYVWTISINME